MFEKLKSMLGDDTPSNVHIIPAETIKQWVEAGEAVIVDVREPNEFQAVHIVGALNLPLSTFNVTQLPEVPEGKKLVIHCRSGVRCGTASKQAVDMGYKGEINRMEGGIMAWNAAGGLVQTP